MRTALKDIRGNNNSQIKCEFSLNFFIYIPFLLSGFFFPSSFFPPTFLFKQDCQMF